MEREEKGREAEQEMELAFDLEEWQEGLKLGLSCALQELLEEHDEVYAISLVLTADLWAVGVQANTKNFLLEQAGSVQNEDYLYYKYAEEEWGIDEAAAEIFEDLTQMLQECLSENSDLFTDENYDYSEAFQEFRDQILASSLRVFREFVTEGEGSRHPEISWNFYVRELFEAADMLELYRMLNQDETRRKEFASILEL
ncbi:MAG: DUF4303 domain-containing protein [bacterium]|nr:DUF4303 domain-containing protein [bacterium]